MVLLLLATASSLAGVANFSRMMAQGVPQEFIYPFIVVSYGGMFLLGLVVLRSGLSAAARDRNRLALETASYEAEMEVWQRSYYCGRCDTTFDSMTGKAVEPS